MKFIVDNAGFEWDLPIKEIEINTVKQLRDFQLKYCKVKDEKEREYLCSDYYDFIVDFDEENENIGYITIHDYWIE